jgi:hypothetical protein
MGADALIEPKYLPSEHSTRLMMDVPHRTDVQAHRLPRVHGSP